MELTVHLLNTPSISKKLSQFHSIALNTPHEFMRKLLRLSFQMKALRRHKARVIEQIHFEINKTLR